MGLSYHFYHGSQGDYITWTFQPHHSFSPQPHPMVESLTLKVMTCTFVSEPPHRLFSIPDQFILHHADLYSCFMSWLRYHSFWDSSLNFHGLNAPTICTHSSPCFCFTSASLSVHLPLYFSHLMSETTCERKVTSFCNILYIVSDT